MPFCAEERDSKKKCLKHPALIVIDKNVWREFPVDNLDDVLGRALPRFMTRLLALDARPGVVPPSRFLFTGSKRATHLVTASLQAFVTKSSARIGATTTTSPRR